MTTVTKHWRSSAGTAEISLLKSPSSILPASNLKRVQTVLAFHNQSVFFSFDKSKKWLLQGAPKNTKEEINKVIASFAAAKEMNVALQFHLN